MSAVDAGLSDDVLRLVQTVERLENEDQERILKLVNLLMVAPVSVRERTQVMLRDLLDRDMRSMLECIAAVDEVLAYLEASARTSQDYLDAWQLFEYPAVSLRRN